MHQRMLYRRWMLAATWTVGAGLLVLITPAARGGDPVEMPEPAPLLNLSPLASTRAMSLDEALAYARAHQPALRAALARVSAVGAERAISEAQWLPHLAATVQGIEGTSNNTTASYVAGGRVDIPRIGGTPATRDGSWRPAISTLAAVGLTQEIFDFGRISAQAAVADAAYEVEGYRARTDALRVDFLVRDAFYGVQGAHAVVRAADGAWARARAHRDLAAAKVKTGLIAAIELTRADADLARFDVGRVTAAGALLRAQGVFAAAVGVSEALLDAVGAPPAAAPVPPFADALKQVLADDPILMESRGRIRTSEQLTNAIAAEARPDLVLTSTFSGRAGTATPSSGPSSDRYGPLPSVPNWDVGLVLRVPIYDAVVRARRQAVARDADVARANLDILTQQERGALQDAYVSLQVSQAGLLSLSRAVEASLANYAQAEARFKAGLATAVELADAEALRTDAEIQLAVGQFDASRARARITRLMPDAS